MPDYGHDLHFGSFITPTNVAPSQVVRLAQISEEAGLDLVTFQDHPYHAGFLDTWTLLSFVAARTERVRLSANVLNLPLRPPAVIARSAASLDLLSGGRFELGLGAGGFWDAIEAMGGRRLTAGQSVDALAEAITIIRGSWDTADHDVFRFDGRYYSLNGAKRGPAPAHPVSIWLGALKPRMLRLIGTAADGWLPSLAYLPGGARDLDEGNRVIDEAAARAGRDPRAIRRLLNIGGRLTDRPGEGLLTGPTETWIEQLTDLATTQGIGTFILASDDPELITIFGSEIAPAVRAESARRRS